MPICVVCNATFKAKRVDARLCSTRCRVAAHRGAPAVTTGAPGRHVTDNPGDYASLSVPAVPDAPGATATTPAIDLGRLPGDTVPDRRWRILLEDGGYTLQCEAMRPGGWMSVGREPDLASVRRFAAWMGLTIAPVEVAAEPPELIAA